VLAESQGRCTLTYGAGRDNLSLTVRQCPSSETIVELSLEPNLNLSLVTTRNYQNKTRIPSQPRTLVKKGRERGSPVPYLLLFNKNDDDIKRPLALSWVAHLGHSRYFIFVFWKLHGFLTRTFIRDIFPRGIHVCFCRFLRIHCLTDRLVFDPFCNLPGRTNSNLVRVNDTSSPSQA
jgi:hypothetical protein